MTAPTTRPRRRTPEAVTTGKGPLDRLFEFFILGSIGLVVAVSAIAYILPGLLMLSGAAIAGLIVGVVVGRPGGLLEIPYVGQAVAVSIALSALVGIPLAALLSLGFMAQLVVGFVALALGYAISSGHLVFERATPGEALVPVRRRD